MIPFFKILGTSESGSMLHRERLQTSTLSSWFTNDIQEPIEEIKSNLYKFMIQKAAFK